MLLFSSMKPFNSNSVVAGSVAFISKNPKNHLQIPKNPLTLQKKLRVWESILTLGLI